MGHVVFPGKRRHTRYIGDWGSDVCSSDLRGYLSGGATFTFGAAGKVATAPERSDQEEERAQHRQQIGRASCRERGQISEVAGALRRRRGVSRGDIDEKRHSTRVGGDGERA